MSDRPGEAAMTLIEVLIAMSIGALVLGLVGGLLGSARAAARAEERATEPERALDLAAELMAEDVAMAGYEPWRLEAATPGPQVVLGSAENGDAVSVGFVDDRLAGPAEERWFTFEVAKDSRGVPQLYRRSGSSPRQPLVEGIDGLEVEAIVTAAGASVPSSGPALHEGVRGLVLLLRSVAGVERVVVVPTPSRPALEVR